MSGIDVRVDWKTSEVRALLAKLQPPRSHRALSVAVNDTLRQVRRGAVRTVGKESGLKRADVDKAVTIKPYSTAKTLSGTVRGSGAPIALFKFQARQTRRGVTAKAWGARKTYPGTFVATMRSGHTGVFKRTSSKRLPIKELWGAGVTQTMTEEAIMSSLEELAQERLYANVVRQLNRYAFR